MRTATLLALIPLILTPAAALGQAADGTTGEVAAEDYMSPGWFSIVENPSSPPGRLVAADGEIHVTTGAAQTYIPKTSLSFDAGLREAKGDYTVSATFRETSNGGADHLGGYGPAIVAGGGEDSGDSYLYCAASADGTFNVGGAGPGIETFQLTHPVTHPAVHTAAARGVEVTQHISLSVKSGNVQCAINGIIVAAFQHAAVVVPGKLGATDGYYGFHVGRDTDVKVSALTLTKD